MGNNAKIAIVMWALCASFGSHAADTDNQKNDHGSSVALQLIGDKYHNSIPIMQHRFRIDYKVKQVTMVFFRRPGTAPVVLVRPDGSKLFQSRVDKKKVDWAFGRDYDVIKINHPTPGPWQAMGQILPGSRVMVLSDVELHVKPLPKDLLAGEIYKQAGTLTNGGEAINNPAFKSVVSLSIKFVSTNNPNFNNFGSDDVTVATFKDDGRGMDEMPNDGVFTGQYNLTLGAGEWQPVYIVKTPLLTREQRGKKVRVLPNPVHFSVDKDHDKRGYHILSIDVDPTEVDRKSLLVDGKLRYPGGDVQHFSLTDMVDKARELHITDYEHGVFRVKVTAYGNTVDGRPFILDVPEYSFLVEQPELAETEAGADKPGEGPNADAVAEQPQLKTSEPVPAAIEPDEGADDGVQFWLIILVNVILLIGGGALIWYLLRPGKGTTTARKDIDS